MADEKKHIHCSLCGHMLCPHLSAEVERLREQGRAAALLYKVELAIAAELCETPYLPEEPKVVSPFTAATRPMDRYDPPYAQVDKTLLARMVRALKKVNAIVEEAHRV